MKRWKKMLISLLLLVLVAAGYGFYLYYKKPPDVRKLDAQFTLNAADLVNEFNHDENAANKKYVDKIIAVKGSISDIQVDTSGQATVFLESGDPMSAVTCSFYQGEANTVKQLQKGMQATIKGNCTGKLSDVILNKCSIVK